MAKLDVLDVVKMRLDGATQEEIATKCGASKQSVCSLLKKLCGDRRYRSRAEIVYPNIAEFMRERGLSASSLANCAGISCSNIRKKLRGDADFSQRQVDALISFTGIPYEKLFARGGRE